MELGKLNTCQFAGSIWSRGWPTERTEGTPAVADHHDCSPPSGTKTPPLGTTLSRPHAPVLSGREKLWQSPCLVVLFLPSLPSAHLKEFDISPLLLFVPLQCHRCKTRGAKLPRDGGQQDGRGSAGLFLSDKRKRGNYTWRWLCVSGRPRAQHLGSADVCSTVFKSATENTEGSSK